MPSTSRRALLAGTVRTFTPTSPSDNATASTERRDSSALGGLAPDVLLLDFTELRRVAGISRTAAYRLLAVGRLRARKLGTKTMVEADSLRTLFAELPVVELTGNYVRAPRGGTSDDGQQAA